MFEDIVNKGRTTMVALNDFTPLQGGVPIEFQGMVIGAVGVSGAASAQQDEELAIAGANALKAMSAMAATMPVTYIESKKVSAAFAKGMPLLEVDQYKVHASRRTEPGLVEVHNWETDVVYVLEGSATLVTGGTIVRAATSGEGNAPAAPATIEGGVSRRVAKGDVILIPAGTPHGTPRRDYRG